MSTRSSFQEPGCHGLSPEKIIALPKDKSVNNKKYRVLTIYSLQDMVLQSIISKYLRSNIDPWLSHSCFSFRHSEPGTPTITHHDAAQHIIRFSLNIPKEKTLWVAECDIQGFFDCIAHDVLIAKLDSFFQKHSIKINHNIYKYIINFLHGYSYKNARERAVKFLENKHIIKPKLFDNEEVFQKANINTFGRQFGIPQGSALSIVFANLVLNDIDGKVNNQLNDSESFYARYCDDVMFISSNKEKCTSAINEYCDNLKELDLPYHPRNHVTNQDKEFWATKSKYPFPWIHENSSTQGMHWIGFVGYQMKRNGQIRIRRSSIDRELANHKIIIDDILTRLNKKIATELHDTDKLKFHQITSIENKVLSHMVLRSVKTQRTSKYKTWSDGFCLMAEHDIDKENLKILDKSRNRAMKRLKYRLNKLAKNPQILFCKKSRTQRKVHTPLPRYYGKPYSYYHVFDQKKVAQGFHWIKDLQDGYTL